MQPYILIRLILILYIITHYFIKHIDNEMANSSIEDSKRIIDKMSEDIHTVKSSNLDLNNQLKESKSAFTKHMKEYEVLFNKSSSVSNQSHCYFL